MKKTKAPVAGEGFADLMERIGDVPLHRVRIPPAPGSATEQDVIAAREGPAKRLCELVDGVLVEKTMGTPESALAMEIGRFLANFVRASRLGIVLGADGMLRLMPGLVRIPDVSFIPWRSIPGNKLTSEAIAPHIPDLAVEVLSPSNTRPEIKRKLRDYFIAGTRLVWVVQPKTETAEIYTSPTNVRRVGKTGSLNGGEVLPGFTLSLPDLFSCMDLERQMPTGGPP